MNTYKSYEQLNNKKLVGFYFELLQNIFKGHLSEAMFNEIELLEIVALKRGIELSFYKKTNKKDHHSYQLMVVVTSRRTLHN
ncbi:hypothetical protein [Halobacillus mangrovi]|uniref:hypothetical protein n=1 Tax=Halobacillus mangrovi TaxID=402384 RepID=UPI003D995385